MLSDLFFGFLACCVRFVVISAVATPAFIAPSFLTHSPFVFPLFVQRPDAWSRAWRHLDLDSVLELRILDGLRTSQREHCLLVEQCAEGSD